MADEAGAYGIETSLAQPVRISTDEKLDNELIGSSISFKRADGAGWSAPEAEAMFGECVRSSWLRYAQSHQLEGGPRG